MEEEQKQDYRQHLINTIDTLIESGVSVYDLNVVNKKAIRYNYILKSKVEEEMKGLQEEYELLFEHQNGQESNRTKYLIGKMIGI